MAKMIGELVAGSVDIVGDIHGEIEALDGLLSHLGYNEQGFHPDGRRLVFVGDLVDRGPDSPAVLRKVRRFVESSVAQAVLGNHELNLLRGDYKDGNGWFFDDQDHRDRRFKKFLDSVQIGAAEQDDFLAFFSQLPVALEREDLRVVHACWDKASILALQGGDLGVRGTFEKYEGSIHSRLESDGTVALTKVEQSESQIWLNNPYATPKFLPGLARRNVVKQMGNPLRILTSGIERETTEPFFSSGEWRFVERVNWWNEYQDSVPVVVGHYWRWATDIDRESVGKGGPDLFSGIGMSEWHGARKNVFCVDFSVGRRFLNRERQEPYSPACRLGALRWPERELVFDNGDRSPTTS